MSKARRCAAWIEQKLTHTYDKRIMHTLTHSALSAQLEVLKGFDWSHATISVLLIEVYPRFKESYSRFLSKHGLVKLSGFTSPTTLNEVWYNASIITPIGSVPNLTPPSAQPSRTNERTKSRARQRADTKTGVPWGRNPKVRPRRGPTGADRAGGAGVSSPAAESACSNLIHLFFAFVISWQLAL